MYSIGQLSEITRVKVPTIRFYEEKNLIKPTNRSEGNQRRYSQAETEKLSFIKHARDLGLGLDSIRKLIELNNHPEQNCRDANEIAETHLKLVKEKIKKLKIVLNRNMMPGSHWGSCPGPWPGRRTRG